MTVIRGFKITYPCPNSPNSDDEATLSVGNGNVVLSPGDTESVHNEPRAVNSRFPRQSLKPWRKLQLDELKLKRNCGRKKMRRYQNSCILKTLVEEDEKENVVTVMESYMGPFSRLHESKAAMECWNEFIEKSEEEQTEIVKFCSEKVCNNALPESPWNSDSPGRISSRLRRTLKIRKNLCIESVQVCEEDVLEFFKTKPEDVYVRVPSTSFNRLLIHAIAQYHNLTSISALENEGTRRSVKVYNTSRNWSPVDSCLTNFIKTLRK